MSEGRFENIEACVFDAYGTLLDFDSAAKRAKDTLGNNANALSSIWRQKALVQRSRIRPPRSLRWVTMPAWPGSGRSPGVHMPACG
jgi:FMN phosphatase YigB (HAD superfamily)